LNQNKTQILQNAQAFTVRGLYDKAIEEWKKLITESPNDGNIYNTIGDLHLKLNDLNQAVEAYIKAAEAFHTAGFALKTIALYKKIIKLNPKRYDINLRLGDLNAERGLTGNAIEDYLSVAKQYSQDGRIKDALEVYRKIANLDPANTNIRLKLAEMCLKEGYEEQAVTEYLQVASVYTETGRTQEAERIYEQALKLDPKNEAARAALGMAPKQDESVKRKDLLSKAEAAMEKEAYDQAEQILRQLTIAEPSNPLYQEKLGYLFLKKGQQFTAFTAMKSAANEYLGADKAEPAAKLMKDYLAVDPDQIEAHQILATAYEAQGDLHQAIPEYARVIDEHLAMSDLGQAEPIYEKIKTLNPEHRDVKRLRLIFEGRAVQSPSPTLENSAAQRAAERSLPSTGPQTPSQDETALKNFFTEAEVYIKYGLTAKAIEQFQQVLTIDPGNVQAHLRLKELYILSGQPDQAATECLKLAEIFKERGETASSEKAMEEARGLSPVAFKKEGTDLSQPIQMPSEPSGVEPALSQETPSEDIAAGAPSQTDEEVEIEARMAEADLYHQRGLIEEARKLYELILALKPDHAAALTRLERLVAETSKPSKPLREPEVVPPKSPEELSFEEELEKSLSSLGFEEPPATPAVSKPSPQPAEAGKPASTETEGGETFDDLSRFLEEEVKETPAAPQPAAPPRGSQHREQGLRAVISEAQGKEMEGGEKEIDYETHYNLGIAYKEMGLITEALTEFRLSARSPERAIDSLQMLASCFQQKGMSKEAMETLEEALSHPQCQESQRPWLSYDLALLYEQNDRLVDALKLYKDIHQQDRNFKDVLQRLDALRKTIGEPTGKAQKAEPGEEKEEDIESMVDRIFGESSPGPRPAPSTKKDREKKKSRISYL
jgi:tetratricopeptide (TPR) repeat protein